MAEKDIAEKQLLSYADVFANILNVGLFDGDEVIHPEELTDVLPQSTYKADGKLREQERDVAKLWKDSELRLALFGLENQSAIDKTMPLRIMGYDGAAYRNELNAKDVKMYPIAWLPDDVIAKFSNPFRMVAEYFSQMRKKQEYHPSEEYVRHAKEMLDLMALLTKDVRFKEAKNNVKEGASMTMRSILLDQIEEKSRAEGEACGEARGTEKTWVASARNIMKNMKLTAQQAVDALSVPTELRAKVLEQL